jgi:hypothetical protein
METVLEVLMGEGGKQNRKTTNRWKFLEEADCRSLCLVARLDSA